MSAPKDRPLRSRTLETLEYPQVMAKLAAYTSTSMGQEEALALRPAWRTAEVRSRLQVTEEALRLLQLQPETSVAGAQDLRLAVQLAGKGATLEATTLLELLATLEIARHLRSLLERHADQVPALSRLGQSCHPLPELAATLRRSLSPLGEVLDSASRLLASLRAQTRATHGRLMGRLRELLAIGQERGWLQEPLITQRSDRYVLPVKVEYRAQLPGILHDVSSSGATLFMEPLATVELGNAWVEAQREESREVERILRQLSAEVGASGSALLETVEALAQMDLALAKARLARSQKATLPQVLSRGEQRRGVRPPLRLLEARHPLLPVEPVPITLEVGGETAVLLISGPNTGGKTVALKTAGLLVLMAQAGLAIPAAEGSQIPVFDGVYADIGDDQSITQSLSTFSSHLGNIIAMLEEATERSLVLLDELAAGTDPTEGSALARALLLHLQEQGVTLVATTHHGELKALAHERAGMENASVEFDLETLAPAFRLIPGLPGPSNALAIASRLGLPGPILEHARSLLPPGQQALEGLLADLQAERERAAELRRHLEGSRAEAARLQEELHARLAQLDEERARLVEAARQRALERVEEVERELERVVSRWASPPVGASQREESLRRLKTLRERIARQFEGPSTDARPRLGESPSGGPERRKSSILRRGTRVRVPGLEVQGRVLTPPDAQDRVTVQAGPLRVTVSTHELLREAATEEPRPEGPAIGRPRASPSTGEIDLRGHRAEEATALVDRHLNSAFLSGQPRVRLIHGQGTGALRQSVRQMLGHHALVRSFHPGEPHEGGDGVTVVELDL